MAHNFEGVIGSLHNFSSEPTTDPKPTVEQQKNIDDVVKYIVDNHSFLEPTVREHICRLFLE